MPSDRVPTHRPEDPDAPTPLARTISIALAVTAIAIVGVFFVIAERELLLPEKMTVSIIALGVVAGLVHAFGVVPEHRQLRAFASPVVAWPVMLAGLVTLLTS